jgi:hypothetical protein
VLPCGPDELRSDAAVSGSKCDSGVLDKGMDQAIPDDVDKADETLTVSGDNPAETEATKLVGPVIVKHAMLERLRV